MFICALVALVAANEDAEVLKQYQEVNPDGFKSGLDLGNGAHRSESGDEHKISGDFGWVAPDGTHVEVAYIADENGYQPKSDLLPTPPPVPEAIARAIEWINSHPQAPEHH
ncbi:hypothetical protein KR222_002693 [Zaprionus bogoriensis]|nr:hypothetical protein KR222_002693 [Zaprionus bogoriensis]